MPAPRQTTVSSPSPRGSPAHPLPPAACRLPPAACRPCRLPTPVSCPPMSLRDTARHLRDGTLRSRDLVEACLTRIDEWQPATNAFIEIDAAGARRAADAADTELARGFDRGVLHGVPVSLKDLLDQQGHVTSAGSRSMTAVAAADAPAVAHLRGNGAVFVGRTNMHEFALGTTSEDSGFGAVRHHHDPRHSAGGSSGGAAVSVATGMSHVAIGSDTGGSVRIPAAALRPGRAQARVGRGLAGRCRAPQPDLRLRRPARDVRGRRLGDAAGAASGRPAAGPAIGPGPAGPLDRGAARVRVATGDARDWRAGRRGARPVAAGGAAVQDVPLSTAPTVAATYSTIVMREALDFHTPRLATHAALYTAAVGGRLQAAARAERRGVRGGARGAGLDRGRGRGAARSRRRAGACPGWPSRPPPLGQSQVSVARRRGTDAHRHVALDAALQSFAASRDRAADRASPATAGRSACSWSDATRRRSWPRP